MTAAGRIATVCGLGRVVPIAPGSVASLLAVVIAWGLAAVHGQLLVLVAAIAVTAVGFRGSEIYARERNVGDPSECVIDEVAGQLIACAFASRSLVAYALSFLLFRALDILKPWPVSAAERLPGGFGIMADDVLAGLLAGVVIIVLVQAKLVA